MGHRQGALDVLQGQGLGVLPADAAGGGVAHVAHRQGAPQLVQLLGVEHLPHQAQILVEAQLQPLHGGDAAGLLAPVLEGVESVIGRAGAAAGRVVDAEHAAFFVDCHGNSPLYLIE